MEQPRGLRQGLGIAALGHGEAQTLWRHYAGVFAEAEVGVRLPIEEAVAALLRGTPRAA